MKKLNANEMRKVDGSFWILAGIAVVAGTSIGKAIRIRYEHARAAGHANTDGNRHHTLRFAK